MYTNRHSLYSVLLFLSCFLTSFSSGWAQRIKSVPFSYQPDASEDRYNQRIPHKAYSIDGTDFIILSRKSDKGYAVERYGADLKIKWTAPLDLLGQETIEAFLPNAENALVITHRAGTEGSQSLHARLINLNTGKEIQQKKLMEAPSKSRRLGIAVSDNGSKLVTYHYLTRNEQIQAIQAAIFEASLNKVKDRVYDFNGIGSNVSANIQIDNYGNQYVSLLTDNSMKMSVRRYNNRNNEIKVMEVMLGGIFDNEKVYIMDTKFQLQQDSTLYAAAFVAEEKTGEYRSLKMIRFDYNTNTMRFADEFKFTPEFAKNIAKASKSSNTERLTDISLSDILVSNEKQTLIIAEKKYTEGDINSNYVAKEMLLFAYDEYLKPTWNSVIIKNQVAPANEGLFGISYSARLFNNRLQLLTLETINGKTDLYTRSIHLLTGGAEGPKSIGLNVANDKQISYVKDFTTWLDERTVIAVNRPSKASAGLRLSKITFK